MRITDNVLSKDGYSTGCEGCEFELAGGDSHRANSGICRQRIYDAMMQNDRDKQFVENARRMMADKYAKDNEAKQNEVKSQEANKEISAT